MRKRKPTTHESPKPHVAEEKILDVNASMQGTLRFDDPVNLRINGKFDGTLDAKGMLMIGQKAEINANITCERISIAGVVNGDIIASKALRMESTAQLSGNIQSPRLSISEGAILNGSVDMGNAEASTIETDLMTVDQLAAYLEVESSKIQEWIDDGMLAGTMADGEMVFDKNTVDQWISEGKVKV